MRSSAPALTFQALLRFDEPDDVAKKLVAYGQFLYDEGRSVAELRRFLGRHGMDVSSAAAWCTMALYIVWLAAALANTASSA